MGPRTRGEQVHVLPLRRPSDEKGPNHTAELLAGVIGMESFEMEVEEDEHESITNVTTK